MSSPTALLRRRRGLRRRGSAELLLGGPVRRRVLRGGLRCIAGGCELVAEGKALVARGRSSQAGAARLLLLEPLHPLRSRRLVPLQAVVDLARRVRSRRLLLLERAPPRREPCRTTSPRRLTAQPASSTAPAPTTSPTSSTSSTSPALPASPAVPVLALARTGPCSRLLHREDDGRRRRTESGRDVPRAVLAVRCGQGGGDGDGVGVGLGGGGGGVDRELVVVALLVARLAPLAPLRARDQSKVVSGISPRRRCRELDATHLVLPPCVNLDPRRALPALVPLALARSPCSTVAILHLDLPSPSLRLDRVLGGAGARGRLLPGRTRRGTKRARCGRGGDGWLVCRGAGCNAVSSTSLACCRQRVSEGAHRVGRAGEEGRSRGRAVVGRAGRERVRPWR